MAIIRHNHSKPTAKHCASCKRGGIYGVKADFAVTGKRGDGMPYHGHLCANHVEVVRQDGYEVTTRRLVK